MNFPFGTAVTLVQRVKGNPDDFGNDTWTTTNVPVKGAFDPGSSVELVQGQDMLITQPRLFLQPDAAPVAAIDAVIVDGAQYEVDGQPKHWKSPLTGADFGYEIPLRRVTG